MRRLVGVVAAGVDRQVAAVIDGKAVRVAVVVIVQVERRALEGGDGAPISTNVEIAARNGLTKLSMGMSADFATAIAFGATHVRVGSAIFGTRTKPL